MLARLTTALGSRSQARRELKWIQSAVDSSVELEDMVRRRSSGEPLQYILGRYSFPGLVHADFASRQSAIWPT